MHGLTRCQEVSETLRQNKKTVILVTHDISEAIAMGDRVVILSKRPGRIKEDIKLELDCPTSDPFTCRKASNFGDYFNVIWEVLNNEG